MGLTCGIVGLPNVGKSTLFNALNNQHQAEAENYPFCTIDPNQALVAVPDVRLEQLANLAQSSNVVPNTIQITDIAGLVRGASKGQGLGNRFLGHIREVDAILHVVRCFKDKNIHHVNESIEPVRDAELIDTELSLADLQWIEKQLEKKAKSLSEEEVLRQDLLKKLQEALLAGQTLRNYKPQNANEAACFQVLPLLSKKPMIYVANLDDSSLAAGNEYSQQLGSYASKQEANLVLVAAQTEADLTAFQSGEREEYLIELGVKSDCLKRLIGAAYDLLNQITFYTAGPKEARAWNVPLGGSAEDAARCIHSDIARGFIVAETIPFSDYLACRSEAKAKAAGKLRHEGRTYRVTDGDVFHFRFNV